MSMNYILTLRESGHWSGPVVGGKGSALAKITQAGLNVPEAFAITVEAYREFINQPAVSEAFRTTLPRLNNTSDPTVLEETANALRASLLNVSLPPRISDEITHAYSQLSTPSDAPVAVRSSATAEDSPEASFAGQHDSFLYVRGVANVLKAVRECWASLWTTRAISYRRRQGIEPEKVLMAVVVQRMVEAEVSGVLFSVNPVTGDDSQIVVNAVYGLGDTLVSGEATPDQWVLSKQTGEILESSIADKRSMSVQGHGTVTRIDVPDDKRRKPAVSLATLARLMDAGVRLEQHFGCPQDVEWAVGNGQVVILQSRPITTTYRLQVAKRFDVKDGYWSRAGLGEWFQLPLSPLFSTLVLPHLNSAIDSCLKDRLGLQRESPSWSVLHGYYYIRGDVVFTPSLFLLPLRLLKQMRRVPDEWNDEVVPRHVERMAQLRDFQSQRVSTTEILRHFEAVCEASARCFAWIVITGAFAKLSELIFKRAYEYLARECEEPYATLLGGFPNKSIEADEALWNLAEIARGRPELKQIILDADSRESLFRSESTRDWLERFQEWLETYGHRVFELDILHETMSDTPAIALQVVRNYIVNPTQSPASRQRRKLEERQIMEVHFEHILARRRWTRRPGQRVLRLAQKYAAIRENRPFYLHLGWPLMRRDLMELGRRFAEAGTLKSPTNVFFLTNDELRNAVIRIDDATAFGEIHSTIDERRREWETQKSLTPPEHINPNRFVRFLLRRLVQRQAAREYADVLTGTPGSPGKALGNTCLVKSHVDFGKFKQGQILVAPYTTPVWTSLLSLAAGVVTETGGALSHAAIIAREYGIPAVVGVANAVARIPDGTNLEVDGSAGRVCLIADKRRT